MGWVEEQIKQRRDLDDKSFEDSLITLSGLPLKEDPEAETSVLRQFMTGKRMSPREYFSYIRRFLRLKDLALLVFFSAAAAAVGLLLPHFTKELSGSVLSSGDMNHFLAISLCVAAAASSLLLINAIKGYVNARITIHVEKSIRRDAMQHVLHLPASFYKDYNTGELNARFQNVAALGNAIISGVFMTLLTVIMSLAYFFQLMVFAPPLIYPVLFVLLARFSFTALIIVLQRNHARKQLALSSREAGLSYEIINGIQKIRLSGSEKRIFAKWAKSYSGTARVKYRPPLLLRLSPAISLLITLAGSGMIFWLASRNSISASNYMAFVAGYGSLSAAFISLNQVVGTISAIQPIFELARPLLEAEAENARAKKLPDSIKGNIKLEHVSFRYSENGPLILDDLSLDIKEGEYIAVVGHTGCGKSTLVRLLLGFEEPFKGRILFEEDDLRDLDLPSLRRNIGTVIQNGSLFHADILSNITISSPAATEEDAWQAAEIADIAEDIRLMPMGMKTVISEGQGGISGGQKQRIMIARAIVHKPKILIFDEATSALDNKTQKSISDSISRLNCTRIVIAHRLSTIMNADRIIMLDGGRIIEEGDYDTLIKNQGQFARLVERQRIHTE